MNEKNEVKKTNLDDILRTFEDNEVHEVTLLGEKLLCSLKKSKVKYDVFSPREIGISITLVEVKELT